MSIIIGNVIALLACIVMMWEGYAKSKGKILILGIVDLTLFTISNIILGAISGAVVNGVGILRNLLQYFHKFKGIVKITFVLFMTGLSLMLNTQGLIGLIPVVATILYTMFIDLEDVFKFKIVVILNLLLWALYDIYVFNIVSVTFNLLSVVMNVIAMINIRKNIKLSANSQEEIVL